MREQHTELWELLNQVLQGLGKVLGERWEVVLHDFDHPEASIVAIANGHISGRKTGGPITSLGLPMLRNPETARSMFHYRTENSAGEGMQSSTICLRDREGRPFAALCFNWDIGDIAQVARTLQDMVAVDMASVRETFGPDVKGLVASAIDEVLSTVRKPLHALTRAERRRVVEVLEEQGVFMIRGSVNHLATRLGMSRATVYAHLAKVRERRAATPAAGTGDQPT